MLKRYPFEIDAYEAGVIMGFLWQRPRTDPTRIHLEHRLGEVVAKMYSTPEAERDPGEMAALAEGVAGVVVAGGMAPGEGTASHFRGGGEP